MLASEMWRVRMRKPVICLMGPTAAGKTSLAIECAQRFPVDLISVDSALIYQDMDIGTAKPTTEELAAAPHQLIDIVTPEQAYSVADFVADASRAIEASHLAGRVPLLVGGTMMYFNALQNGLSPLPSSDPLVRAELQQRLVEQGVEALHQVLSSVDPASAQRIKQTDQQRIVRALEVFEQTGKTLTDWHQTPPQGAPYQFYNAAIGLTDRAILHQRIALRFEQMLEQGFIEEVECLQKKYNLTPEHPAMRAVGYRQVWQHLAGELTQTELKEKGIVATRQLAKRQITWLRRWQDCVPLEAITAKLF